MLESVDLMLLLLTHYIRYHAVNSVQWLIQSAINYWKVTWCLGRPHGAFWYLIRTSAGGMVLLRQWVCMVILRIEELAVQFEHFRISSHVPLGRLRNGMFWAQYQLLVQSWGSVCTSEVGGVLTCPFCHKRNLCSPKVSSGCSVPKQMERKSPLPEMGAGCWSPAEPVLMLPPCSCRPHSLP